MCTTNAFLSAVVHRFGAQIYECMDSGKFVAPTASPRLAGGQERMWLFTKFVHSAVHKLLGSESVFSETPKN